MTKAEAIKQVREEIRQLQIVADTSPFDERVRAMAVGMIAALEKAARLFEEAE